MELKMSKEELQTSPWQRRRRRRCTSRHRRGPQWAPCGGFLSGPLKAALLSSPLPGAVASGGWVGAALCLCYDGASRMAAAASATSHPCCSPVPTGSGATRISARPTPLWPLPRVAGTPMG